MSDVDDRLREVEIELARIHQRVDDHEGDVVRFAALPLELHELKWTVEAIRKDVDKAHELVRSYSDLLAQERRERVAGHEEQAAELEQVTEARSAQIAQIEADRQAQIIQQKIENRRLLLGLVTIFLTTASAMIVPLLTGGGG